MVNSLRTMILLMLLAFSQIALGGYVRQTTSNRLLENKTPKPIISGDLYISQVILMPDDAVVLQNSGAEKIDVLSNDQFTGYDLDLTTFVVLDQPSNGIALISIGNQISYEPFPNFNGWDSFTYSICDYGTTERSSQCSVAEVKVYVVPSLAGPTATDDYATLSDAPNSLVVDVLVNDFDSDGPFANWDSIEVVAQPAHGIATVTSDYKIEYKPIWSPSERFVGNDTIYYRICDIVVPSLCDYAAVVVQVEQVCVSCTQCGDTTKSFEDHLLSIQKVFRSEVLSL